MYSNIAEELIYSDILKGQNNLQIYHNITQLDICSDVSHFLKCDTFIQFKLKSLSIIIVLLKVNKRKGLLLMHLLENVKLDYMKTSKTHQINQLQQNMEKAPPPHLVPSLQQQTTGCSSVYAHLRFQ